MKTIDIHTHGLGGYDTRTTVEDHVLKIAEIHGSHGVLAIIPTIYPATIKVMRENIMVVKKAMEIQKTEARTQAAETSIRPAQIIGIHLEGPFLNPNKAGSMNAITFIDPDEKRLLELIEGFEDIIRIITISPELAGAPGLIKKISGMGIIASMGHSDATYEEAEAGFNAGAKGVTHLFNAMKQFHHREPGIAAFGLLNKDVYVEVIADTFHLDLKTLELVFRLKDPQKIVIVSDTVKESMTFKPSPSRLNSVLQKWDSSHGITDGRGKLIGGALPVTLSAKKLIEAGFDEEIITKCISENPERYLNKNY